MRIEDINSLDLFRNRHNIFPVIPQLLKILQVGNFGKNQMHIDQINPVIAGDMVLHSQWMNDLMQLFQVGRIVGLGNNCRIS